MGFKIKKKGYCGEKSYLDFDSKMVKKSTEETKQRQQCLFLVCNCMWNLLKVILLCNIWHIRFWKLFQTLFINGRGQLYWSLAAKLVSITTLPKLSFKGGEECTLQVSSSGASIRISWLGHFIKFSIYLKLLYLWLSLCFFLLNIYIIFVILYLCLSILKDIIIVVHIILWSS